MAFESFAELARVDLKRVAIQPSRILVKTEFSGEARGARPQTVFRFADDIVEKAGWAPGSSRIELAIDRVDMAIRARQTHSGGYKLIGGTGRPYLKFTAARGMPVTDEPREATDVVVVGGEVMLVLPPGVRLCA